MKACFHKAGSEKLQSLAKPMTFIKPSGFMNESLSCGTKGCRYSVVQYVVLKVCIDFIDLAWAEMSRFFLCIKLFFLLSMWVNYAILI